MPVKSKPFSSAIICPPKLVFAKRAGRIASVKEVIVRLRAEAHFFVKREIEAIILAEAGENA